MAYDFTMYYDSLTEALWFQDLHRAFEDANLQIIKPRGENPDIIERIIQYDRPDIILLKENTPILVLEKTSEVPTGHNVGQRFARLVRAVEIGIPTIYYFPFDSRKHGKYTGICNLNIRLLDASFKMLEIHNTPMLSINWIADGNGELIVDGSENSIIKELLKSYINSSFDKNCYVFKKYVDYLKREYFRRLKIRPSYGEMPNSVIKMNTTEFMKSFSVTGFSAKFSNRKYTYLYKIGMNPESCKRQDPYTGTQFIYDYILCRNGQDVSDKINNLVLYFPNLTSGIWSKKNPNDPNSKSCNWYLTANALLFKDKIIFNLD